uniref:Uncharacterized protein n=1 Tax=Panagrolaimus davidi TaxID=227884 RepID=A0A914PVF6_9BILA
MVAPIDLRSLFDAELSAAHSWTWTDTVLVQNPFYYQNLSQIILNTSKKAISNYLTLAAVFNLRPYLQIRGDSEDSRKCLKQMSTLDPLANVYASNRNFDYNGFSTFFSDLKNFFIAYNPQLSPNTLSTIRRIDIKVGAPMKIFDDAGLQTAFSTIRIQDDSYEQRKSQNLIPWQQNINNINYDSQNSDYFTTILAALRQQRMTDLSQIGTYLPPGDSVRWKSLETDFIFNQIENELSLFFANI